MGWVKELNLQGPAGASFITEHDTMPPFYAGAATPAKDLERWKDTPPGWHHFKDTGVTGIFGPDDVPDARWMTYFESNGALGFFDCNASRDPVGIRVIISTSGLTISRSLTPDLTDTYRRVFYLRTSALSALPNPGDVLTAGSTASRDVTWQAPSITLAALKAAAADSADFADFQAKIAALT